jgi:hypothetical protein
VGQRTEKVVLAIRSDTSGSHETITAIVKSRGSFKFPDFNESPNKVPAVVWVRAIPIPVWDPSIRMADPLSISASIIAVFQLTGVVITYLKEVRDAPKERKKLLDEAVCVESFLFVLKDKAESSKRAEWYETLRRLNLPNGPLVQCQRLLERLVSKLKSDHGGWKRIGKMGLTWPFEKQEIKDIISSIERLKTLFLLALQNDHAYDSFSSLLILTVRLLKQSTGE